MNENDQAFTLGRIDGKLDRVIEAQEDHAASLAEMDKRLRSVEVAAAKSGAIAGSLVSLGIALIAEGIKAAFHIKA